MTLLLVVILWCLLFAVAWPLALLALVLFPLIWLISLPFRILLAAVGGGLALLKAVFLLPARLLGWRRRCNC